MPQLTVTIDLSEEAYHRIMAFSPPSRSALDAAIQSVTTAVAAAANISLPTDASDFSGVPFFPARDLPESVTPESVLELIQSIQDEEDAEIIAKSGITRR